MSRLERELASKGEQISLQAARQTNASIRTALGSIRDIVILIQKAKNRASDSAKRQQMSSVANVIEATNRLIDKEIAVKQIALPDSEPVTPKEARMPLSADERLEIARRWNEALSQISEHSAAMTQEEKQQIYQQLKNARSELGDIGLSIAATKHTIDKISKQTAKEKTSEKMLVADRAQLQADEQPGPEAKADEQSAISPEQAVVVETTEQLIGDLRSSSQGKETTAHENLKYSAEEFNIYEAGNQVTIADKDNKVLFVYSVDEQTGHAIVIKDIITQDIHRQKSFSHAAAALRQAPISEIKKDTTGIMQMQKLGGLAPEGARAVAIAAMITTQENVVIRRDVRYERTSSQTFIVSREGVAHRDSIISSSSSAHGIKGQYSEAERVFFRKAYEKVAAEYVQQQSEPAADVSKEDSVHQKGDRER